MLRKKLSSHTSAKIHFLFVRDKSFANFLQKDDFLVVIKSLRWFHLHYCIRLYFANKTFPKSKGRSCFEFLAPL